MKNLRHNIIALLIGIIAGISLVGLYATKVPGMVD